MLCYTVGENFTKDYISHVLPVISKWRNLTKWVYCLLIIATKFSQYLFWSQSAVDTSMYSHVAKACITEIYQQGWLLVP